MNDDPVITVHQVKATNTHLLSIVAEDVFDGIVSDERLAAYLSLSGHALFIALSGERVVGQMRGIIHYQPDLPTELYIDNLGVAQGFHRRGVASRLARALVAWSKVHGCASLWVATETENTEARAFYSSLGFEEEMLSLFSSAYQKEAPERSGRI